MQRRLKIALAAGATVIAALTVGGGIAVASGGNDEAPHPIPTGELSRASEVALAETGGGRVTETEIGDEDSYYEVEVTLDDGNQVDVQLDADFKVVKVMDDHEGE